MFPSKSNRTIDPTDSIAERFRLYFLAPNCFAFPIHEPPQVDAIYELLSICALLPKKSIDPVCFLFVRVTVFHAMRNFLLNSTVVFAKDQARQQRTKHACY